MTIKQPFMPHYGTNQTVTVAAGANQAVTIASGGKQLRVVNTGANKAYFRTYSSMGGTTPIASAVDYPVPPGTGAIVTRIGHDTISVFSSAGTTLEVMPGEGF